MRRPIIACVNRYNVALLHLSPIEWELRCAHRHIVAALQVVAA